VWRRIGFRFKLSSLPPPPPPPPPSLALFDLEPRLRAHPFFLGVWSGLSLLDGGYIRRGDPWSGRPSQVSNRTGSRWHRELVLLFFLLFSALTICPRPPTGFSRIPPAAVIHPPSLANARQRMFSQQESNFCWVLFFVDTRDSTCRNSDALAHLHVFSTRRADYFVYSPPSLACKCESEDFRAMRGV